MYHVAIDGAKQGPMTEAELQAKIFRGELKPADLCWTDGWPGWRRIDVAFPAVPPPIPDGVGAAPAFTGTPAKSGLAVASLVFGICTIVLFPLFFLFCVPAIVCGHIARSKIKRAKGALVGAGMALAGLIMGYAGVTLIVPGVLAAMAFPAFSKVRTESLGKMMDNDARQIACAAQQYFLETATQEVEFGYDPATGAVVGPLCTYVQRIAKGYTTVPERLTEQGDFMLGHPGAGPERTYDAEGRRMP